MDLKKMSEDIDKFFDSEECDLSLQKFVEEMRKEDELNQRWAEKTIALLKSKSDKELEFLYEAYIKHNMKRSDILWNQGIDGDSSLSSFILKAFEQLGEDYDVEVGMFTSAAYQYKGYVAELIVGQGSFISIYKVQ